MASKNMSGAELRRAGMESLRTLATAAREKAYAPYSRFKVGAAVMTASGAMFPGCNVENASYGLTICAERSAIFQAVSAGQRQILALAIFTDAEKPTPPCGACRQVLHEFGPEAEVQSFGKDGRTASWRMRDLLPGAFGSEDLEKSRS